MENNSAFDHFEMQLTDTSNEFLREVGKWANFLSIVGFIYLGLMLIGALAIMATGNSALMNMTSEANPAVEQMNPAVMAIIILIMIAIIFFPIYYLNKFAVNVKKAFRENSTESLTRSFEFLKSHYKFVGVFTIIFLSIYILMFIVMIVAAIAGIAD